MPSTRSVASAIIGTEIAAAIAAESAAAEAAAASKTLHDLNDDTLAVCASHLRTQEAWALACISKLVRVAASRDAAWHARVHAWQRRAPLRSWLRRARQRIQQRRVVPVYDDSSDSDDGRRGSWAQAYANFASGNY